MHSSDRKLYSNSHAHSRNSSSLWSVHVLHQKSKPAIVGPSICARSPAHRTAKHLDGNTSPSNKVYERTPESIMPPYLHNIVQMNQTTLLRSCGSNTTIPNQIYQLKLVYHGEGEERRGLGPSDYGGHLIDFKRVR